VLQLTSFDGRFQIDGEEVFLRAGDYHYFRVDPKHWEKDLKLLKEQGKLNCISTYVPWIFHEIYEENFDFDGTTHPRRNIRLFLDICRKLNLPVIFRPGPFIYSEYKGFGIPLWVGENYPEVVVRLADGTMDMGFGYYNISLNHPTYIELIRKWYGKIAEELREYFENPIIIFQLDNETGLMYNFSVGRIDFNPDTIERFHKWLEENFGDPQTLSVYCVESYLSFEEVTPPIDGLNIAKSMIWQSFFEDWIVEYLEKLQEIVMELDIPLLFAINEQGNYFSPSNPEKKSRITEIYGYNITPKISQTRSTLDVPFGNSIVPSIFKGYLQPQTQALFASEIGCGWFDPRVRVKSIATIQTMMGSIAHGAQGTCMYIVRDGEDIEGEKYHYRSMINHRGRKLAKFSAVKSVYEFVEKLGEELTQSEEIYDEIAFASYAMNHRIIPGDFDSSGQIIKPIKIITMQAEYGIFGMLLANGYNPKPIALERISLKEMKKLKTIFFHNRGAIVKADYMKLLDYVKGGGNLVTGPNFPVLNEHGFPLNTQKLYPAVVSKQKIFGRNANILKIMRSYFTFPIEKEFIRNYNQYSLYHLQQTERQNILRSWRPWGSTAQTENGDSLHVDYLAREFAWQEGRTDVEPILKLRNKTIGYRYTLGKGTNTVYGSPLGARYVIDAYYKDNNKVKTQNKKFLECILSKHNVQKTFEADVEIEIIGRFNQKKKSLLIFLLNRGKKKEGTFKILIPAKTRLPKNKSLKVEVVYTYLKSGITSIETSLEKLEEEGLGFAIKKDDTLVLRITPNE